MPGKRICRVFLHWKGAGIGAETDLVTILQMEMRNDMESQGERSVEMQTYVQTFFFLLLNCKIIFGGVLYI